MPYKQTQYGPLIVETEQLQVTLRVFRGSDRVFTCTVTTTGPVTARITNAFGSFNLSVAKAVKQWMTDNGFLHFSFERGKKTVKEFDLR